MKSQTHFSDFEQLMLDSGELPADALELQNLLSEDGADLSNPTVQQALEERLRPVRERSDARRQQQRQRPVIFTRVKNFALTSRDSVALVLAFMLMSVMPFVGVILLFVSEAFSAALGAKSFLNEGFEVVVAWVLSVTLVAFYFSLEWHYASLVHRHGHPKTYQPTFSTFIRWVAYTFSVNPNQKPKEHDDAYQLRLTRTTARWTMALIIILGFLGRLGNELDDYAQDAWYTGFWKILAESSPAEFLEYVGGALIAFVLLIGTRYILSMMHEIYVAAGGGDEGFFDASEFQTEMERVRIQFFQYMMRQRWNRKKKQVLDRYEALSLPASAQPIVEAPQVITPETIPVLDQPAVIQAADGTYPSQLQLVESNTAPD